jgi:hypothetical protein
VSENVPNSLEAPTEASEETVPRRRRMTRAEWWTLVVTAVGVLVALAAWLFPVGKQDSTTGGSGPTKQTAATTPAAAATAATTAPGPVTGSGTVYLDGQPPVEGKPLLVGLPRRLDGQPGLDHPVVVTCPTNQSDDQVHEVTYSLAGRYLTFSANVRPYIDPDQDPKPLPDSRATVLAIAVYIERDGTPTQQVKGRQEAATVGTPGPLTASVERAERLTLQVRCEDPRGVVVLAGAGLTR